ncbi:MAG TPA: hypothetical protein VKU84_08825 [Stellaceae bacterium]|nr:hypothetical protein [Stellaceae bacterium]
MKPASAGDAVGRCRKNEIDPRKQRPKELAFVTGERCRASAEPLERDRQQAMRVRIVHAHRDEMALHDAKRHQRLGGRAEIGAQRCVGDLPVAKGKRDGVLPAGSVDRNGFRSPHTAAKALE